MGSADVCPLQVWPVVFPRVAMWERSAATPGVTGATSKQVRAVTRGLSFISSERGCPMPPAAPRTLHLKPRSCCARARGRPTRAAALRSVEIMAATRKSTQKPGCSWHDGVH